MQTHARSPRSGIRPWLGLLGLAALLMSLGCAASQIETEPESPLVDLKVSDAALKERFDAVPNPVRPLRVAIVSAKRGGAVSEVVLRDNIDQETIDRWTKWISDGPGVEHAQFLPTVLAPPGQRLNLDALRLAAASRKCSLLLIYRQQRRVVNVSNAWAVLYITLVGTLFVPGTECIGENRIEVLLVDVLNGHVYGDAIVTGRGSSLGPLYFLNTWRGRALRRATADAHEKLEKRLHEIFKRLNGSRE